MSAAAPPAVCPSPPARRGGPEGPGFYAGHLGAGQLGGVPGTAAVLAPMAGYSDAPMRQLCREQGALWTVSEMISARGLLEAAGRDDGRLDTPLALARRYEGETGRVIQLFGDDPHLLAAATAHAGAHLGAAAVDLNMGCPVPKLRGRGGACLLQTPELAFTLMRAMRGAAAGDVSAKIRLGWDADHALELAQGLEAAGAALLTVHGRTSAQRYTGEADWEAVARVAAAVRIPVIGSGDVRTPGELRARLDGAGVAGVMVGRGAVGNPWLFAGRVPEAGERAAMARRHARLAADWYGERRGLLQLRKVLPAYFPAQPELRPLLVQVQSLAELDEALRAAPPQDLPVPA